jgi:hypothetical protein
LPVRQTGTPARGLEPSLVPAGFVPAGLDPAVLDPAGPAAWAAF